MVGGLFLGMVESVGPALFLDGIGVTAPARRSSRGLRRFVFKVRVDYLAPEQVRAAFRGYFGLTPRWNSWPSPP